MVPSTSITVRAETLMARNQQITAPSTTRTIFYYNKCSGKKETVKRGTKKRCLWFVFIGA